jgi:predicted transcriptional regulator
MRRDRGHLEDAVVVILGDGAEMSVADVRAALGGDLAHTTVLTVLSRLNRKGAVSRRRSGRSDLYALAAPTGDLPALRAAIRMRRELDGGHARADVLANFVAGLTPEDESLLRDVLARNDIDEKQE